MVVLRSIAIGPGDHYRGSARVGVLKLPEQRRVAGDVQGGRAGIYAVSQPELVHIMNQIKTGRPYSPRT